MWGLTHYKFPFLLEIVKFCDALLFFENKSVPFCDFSICRCCVKVVLAMKNIQHSAYASLPEMFVAQNVIAPHVKLSTHTASFGGKCRTACNLKAYFKTQRPPGYVLPHVARRHVSIHTAF